MARGGGAAERRLRGVHAHIAAKSAAPLDSAIAEPDSPPDIALLSDAAMKEFVVRGYHLIDVAEYSTEWHEAAYAKAAAISEETNANQHVVWDRLTPEINCVIRSPSVRGALTSVLGKDYLFSGGGHMHVTGPSDQQLHKGAHQNSTLPGHRPMLQ